VLGELEILAVVVHLPVLVLTEAVEPLVGAAVELDACGQPRLALDRHRRQPPRGRVFVD
jgi:hypothetical protein